MLINLDKTQNSNNKGQIHIETDDDIPLSGLDDF